MNNPVAERIILSGILNHGEVCYYDVCDLVSIDSFHSEVNQSIYKCLSHAYENGYEGKIDLPSVMSAAHSLGLDKQFERGDDAKYLRALFDYHTEPSSARKSAAKVEKLHIGRVVKSRIEQAGLSLESITGDEKISDIFGLIENPLFELSDRLAGKSGNNPVLIGNGLREYIQYNIDNPVQQIGITTGYKAWDQAIGGGVRGKTINMIGARIKSGKSFLADNFAVNIAGFQNIPIIMLDTEMGNNDHWNRMVAMLSKVSIKEIETGQIPKHKIADVFKAVEFIEKMPYHYISIAGQPFEDTMALLRRWVTKTVGLNENGEAKPCVIIHDYMKLMSQEGMTASGLAEFQLLGFQITALQNFMVRYNTGCISFVQLNRDGITREDSDVISGSDRIAWICSNFSILKRQSEDEMAEQTGDVKYNSKLVNLFQRHGPGLSDGDYINLKADLTYGRIVEGPTRNQAYRINPPAGFEVTKYADDPTKL